MKSPRLDLLSPDPASLNGADLVFYHCYSHFNRKLFLKLSDVSMMNDSVIIGKVGRSVEPLLRRRCFKGGSDEGSR